LYGGSRAVQPAVSCATSVFRRRRRV
jgi:hypothetical protein